MSEVWRGLMLRIPCPKCHKIIYASEVETFHPCPYCGFIFSGKYGPEKRREKRTPQKSSFLFSFQGESLEASTTDLSKNGIGIQISGKPSISEGDVLKLPISDASVDAKIMWVKKDPDKSLAGLQKIN
jgi:hypothetical protein